MSSLREIAYGHAARLAEYGRMEAMTDKIAPSPARKFYSRNWATPRREIRLTAIAGMSSSELPNRAERQREREGRTPLLVMTLAVFVFVAGVYLPSCRYGFVFDEQAILWRTVPPRTISELMHRLWASHFPGLAYFRPVPHATYLVQYMWHRNEPGYFHLFNAVLMGVMACVGFALLRLPCFRIRSLPAALAAALFAVHPIAVPSVVPVVGRETLLAACLTMGAVYAFLQRGWSWYACSMVLLVLALLSKEQAVVIPLLFVLADLLGLSQDPPGRSVRRWLRRYALPALLLTAYLAMRRSLFSGTEYRLQILDHPVGPLHSLNYVLQSIFTPFGEHHHEPALSDWLSWRRLTIAAFMLMVLVWAVRRRGVSRTSAVFWLGWALLTVAPTSNVIEQQAPYSERYLLLASFAVIAVAASVISTIQAGSMAWSWTAFAVVLLIAASATVSLHCGRCFESELSFSRQWARTSPRCGEAQMALGVELHHLGRTAEAADCFRAGLLCEPAARSFCRQWLGKMLTLQGRFSEAETQFRLVIDESPRAPSTLLLSGVACRGMGELDEAVARFEQVVQISPGAGAAHFLLADTLKLQGDTRRAPRHHDIASRLQDFDLGYSPVTDSHLRDLGRFPDLRRLMLGSTPIGDDGLKHLAEANALDRLWIPGTAVTDEGLVHLRRLPNLNSLVLTGTRVADSGVPHLLSLGGLKHLDVRYTGISRDGIRQLKHGLPDCLIVH